MVMPNLWSNFLGLNKTENMALHDQQQLISVMKDQTFKNIFAISSNDIPFLIFYFMQQLSFWINSQEFEYY